MEKTYWRLFVYNDNSLRIRINGWVNPGDLLAPYDKKFDQFLEKKRPIEFVRAFNLYYHIPVFAKVDTSALIMRDDSEPRQTWIYPRLAIMLAEWLDLKFGAWQEGTIWDIQSSYGTVFEALQIAEAFITSSNKE